MWQCPSCSLFNEDLDEACVRCGKSRIDTDEAGSAAAAPAPAPLGVATAGLEFRHSDPAGPTAEVPRSDSPRKSGEGLAWGLIALSLLLLAAIGFVAVQRGLIRLPGGASPAQPTASPAATAPTPPPTPQDYEAAAQASLADPLAMLDDEVFGIAPYRELRDYLRGLDTQLTGFSFESDGQGALNETSIAALDQLNTLGNELNRRYSEFEERCKTETEPALRAYQSTLRRAFRDRMVRVVELAGSANKLEREAVRVAYTLPDTFVATIRQYGIENPQPITDAWLAAVQEREEAILNADNSAILKTLEEKMKALSDVHNEYNLRFAATPPYHVNSGILSTDAVELLNQYEALATKVEELTLDMEKYTQTLNEESLSERMRGIIKSFTELAQQDHLYCFTETYTIYVKDRELTHPVYLRLRDHYAFAESHWPRLREQYVQVYTESEAAWDQLWKQD